MAKQYHSVRIDDRLIPLLENCKTVYEEHHPEMALIEISKSKILYEIIIFYLSGTKLEIKNKGVFK